MGHPQGTIRLARFHDLEAIRQIEIAAGALGPELLELRQHEQAAGLDRWARTAMRCELPSGALGR